jgi:hypothetical protein
MFGAGYASERNISSNIQQSGYTSILPDCVTVLDAEAFKKKYPYTCFADVKAVKMGGYRNSLTTILDAEAFDKKYDYFSDVKAVKTRNEKGEWQKVKSKKANSKKKDELKAVESKNIADTMSEICRDFLRGECKRSDCIFSHNVPICYDFKFKKCFRPGCRYLHE